MLKSGLVSISFRDLSVEQIINIVKKAQLDAIEWGGDIHVPHGNVEKAQYVYEQCKRNHISCPSYGSYYKIGTYENYIEEFSKVLQCAIVLHSKTIRVWAGIVATTNASKKHWNNIVTETKEICNMAAQENINIAFEFHGGTLTDTASDTNQLITLIDKDNLYTYWQPPVDSSITNNCDDIKLLYKKISNLHVFQWDGRYKLPLKEGLQTWKTYLKLFRNTNRYCLLEFVKNNSIEQFYEDAATLKDLLNE